RAAAPPRPPVGPSWPSAPPPAPAAPPCPSPAAPPASPGLPPPPTDVWQTSERPHGASPGAPPMPPPKRSRTKLWLLLTALVVIGAVVAVALVATGKKGGRKPVATVSPSVVPPASLVATSTKA